MTENRLKQYQQKRKFNHTPEPKGRNKKDNSRKPIFVIQKHQASRLHYDFRLEVEGVLISWAVPKGPSTDPRVKRLAVQVEDHPLEYADFEGIIPESSYGSGQVMIWDRGNYKNLRQEKEKDRTDMLQSLKEGKLEIWLDGEKLTGGYYLIRTGKKDNKKQWLLMKAKDREADARRNPVSTQPNSVKSNRTLAQIRKEGQDHNE